jgi:hypothetical protein
MKRSNIYLKYMSAVTGITSPGAKKDPGRLKKSRRVQGYVEGLSTGDRT